MKTSIKIANLVGMRFLKERQETYWKFEVKGKGSKKTYFLLSYKGDNILLDNVFDAVPNNSLCFDEIYRICINELNAYNTMNEKYYQVNPAF